MSHPPLIAHVIFRFDVGGLENGVVNLINRLPEQEFRHAVVALTEATEFKGRLKRADVQVHALRKRPGKDPRAYVRLFGLLRRLRPDVVHTRNLGTMECQVIAFLAGARVRIHGEHGWDIHDRDGTNRKYRTLRRLLNPFVHRFVTVSADLERWLVERIRIPSRKVQRICNGVDVARFHPAASADSAAPLLPVDRFPPGALIVGSVTRFEPIKDPLNLVRAFIQARRELASEGSTVDLRLLMIGDGPLRQQALALLEAEGQSGAAWLPGSRDNVAQWLHCMHVFALGSSREGISNTVLEAMATGLPVIASATGGNLELVKDGQTGMLVPPENSPALAHALLAYARDAQLLGRHGRAARARAEAEFSLDRMVGSYRDLYRRSCAQFGVAA
jgi:sugar transferase (PEP-CTERM/EpsH1 system associated)